MSGDKHKTVSVILSKLGKDGESDSTEVMPQETVGKDSDKHDLAQDIIMAVKNGNAQNLMHALDAYYAKCELEEGQD